MNSVVERARAYLAHLRNEATDKTDEMGVLSVLSVPELHKTSQLSEKRTPRNGEIKHRAKEQILTAALISAAMRACDFWGDGEEARQAMRQDVLSYPPAMRPELLDYFNRQYPHSPDLSGQ